MSLPDYAIEARNVVKTYAATKTTPEMKALKGVDLLVPRGSVFGLLGPNGAGKSTFINILAGLVRKTSGTVKIWGRDIDERPRDARAAIGVVPQEIAADPFFTPRESLEVQAGMYGVPPRERRSMELLTALGDMTESLTHIVGRVRLGTDSMATATSTPAASGWIGVPDGAAGAAGRSRFRMGAGALTAKSPDPTPPRATPVLRAGCGNPTAGTSHPSARGARHPGARSANLPEPALPQDPSGER